ncbi:MAG: TolC family outer membrane protein [Succinivibrio sp.]
MNIKFSAVAVALSACVCLSAQAEDLMDIYKEALQRDTVVAQAKSDADAAHASLSEATAALLPQIDVVGKITKTRTSIVESYNERASNKSSTAGINLSQAIWRHSAWANRSIAEKSATAKDLAYADAQQNLIVRVSNAYFNVLNAADTLKYSKANNAALKRQLDEADRKLQVGLIAETDKLEAQAAYDLSSANVIAAENNLINSYEDIRMLIGRSIDISKLSKLDESRFDTPRVPHDLRTIIKTAEENNLSLQMAVVNRDIAKDSITLARSGHEPTLDLNASANTGYTSYTTEVKNYQQNGNDWSKSVGLTLNIPIFHGGATSAQVDKAQAQYISASEKLEQSHRSLLSNVNNSYNNVNAAISCVVAYNNSVVSADSALKATIAGYDVGTRTMTDVLNATQNLYSSMQKAAEARYGYIESRLALLYAEGKLKVEHLSEINSGLEK